jgi:hypothetical protein
LIAISDYLGFYMEANIIITSPESQAINQKGLL